MCRFRINGSLNKCFIQTTYSVVEENLHTTANGTHWKNGNATKGTSMRVNNNTIQFFDKSYGWCDVYAVNINQIKEHGSGHAAVYNSKMHGSIMHVYHKDGRITLGIILDACGQAAKEPKIDKWVYHQEKENEVVNFTIKRFGWK